MAITTKQGYLRKKGTSGQDEMRYAVKTLASLITDVDRNQTLAVSLANMIERNALGYPVFSTLTSYATDDEIYHDRRLWKFTSAHQGAWDANDVREFSVKEYMDALSAHIGYYECDTASATAAKTISASGFVLKTGGAFKIKMTHANSATSPTLNINNTGASSLYYDGAIASPTNTWEDGETLDVYFDGTNYMANNVSGGGKFAGGEKVKEVDINDYATKEALESGEVIPALVFNLQSWQDEQTPVANSWAQTIRTTAGDDPVNTDDGGVFKGMNAGNGEDFMAEAVASTGYNQLRLTSDGGQAKSLSSDAARVIPVPHLKLGNFGTAEENNGMLFTGKPSGYQSGFAFGGSDLQPTVRFAPLSSGEPTSTSDGEAVTPTAVTYQDEIYHTYLTSGEGWLIVTPPSGVAWSDICAHIAWEDWYDRFVSPTDAADNSGDIIDLTPIATALTNGLNGTGKLLYLAEGIFTKVERTSETTVLITDPVARLTSPVWTNTLQEDNETYLHTLTISGMKPNGAARIEGSSQYLTVSGNVLSYADKTATAISGAVRYERETPATATAALGKTSYSLNDCGVEIKVGATGTGYVECEYVQNVADAVRMLASVKIVSLMQVIAEALCSLKAENDGLKAIINNPTRRIDAEEYRSCGFPVMLSGKGAPNASVVPNEWTDEMGVWTGVPMVPGQEYFDTQNNKWYKAKMPITGATSDWLLLN